MEIVRVLNNNAVMSEESGKMVLLMGLSVGFHKRPGDLVDEKRVEKRFVLANPDTWTKLHELLLNIPDSYLDFAGDMVQYAQKALNRQLSDNLLITLTDHIYSALERYQKGIALKNSLLWDIQRFYQAEYAVSVTILERINQSFGVRFEEDEAGFIAFHLASAEMEERGQLPEVTRLMHTLTELVGEAFPVELSGTGINYQRFVTHLKFFSQRVLSGRSGGPDEDVELLDLLRDKYAPAYRCAMSLCAYAKEHHGYEASTFDLLSLTMHIARLASEGRGDGKGGGEGD